MLYKVVQVQLQVRDYASSRHFGSVLADQI